MHQQLPATVAADEAASSPAAPVIVEISNTSAVVSDADVAVPNAGAAGGGAASTQQHGAAAAEVTYVSTSSASPHTLVAIQGDDRLTAEQKQEAIHRFHQGLEWHTDTTQPPMGGTGAFVKNPLGHFTRCCGGRCVMHPGAPISWCWISCLILFCVINFCVVVTPSDEIWSKVVACVLAIFPWLMLAGSNCIDPGIVMPKRVDEVEPLPVGYRVPNSDHHLQLEVCRTCHVVRPPRSSHCTHTDACLIFYDHYCGVTNCAVAANTHRFFTMFMFAIFVLVCFLFFRTLLIVIKGFELDDEGKKVWTHLCAYLILVICVLATCCVGPVGCHYVYLSCIGKSLKDERGRKRFIEGEDTMSCSRCIDRLCGELVPSQLPQGEYDYLDGKGRIVSSGPI